ncbi:MAG: metallophosphoesterase [Solirubrobacterales bacterium]
MALYAISDLHLDLNGEKPMDIFGEQWMEHDGRLKDNWLSLISEEDTVLVAGDISWSMTMEEAGKELDWIHDLPGNKIFVKGNHDYWWGSINKLNNLYDDMKFIQNNFFSYEEYAICGTRGWVSPGGDSFTQKDQKIYERELIRLRLSVDSAIKAGFKKFIFMLHYPPFNEKLESGFIEIINEIKPKAVVYGHLHGPSAETAFCGVRDEVQYIITSSDYLKFNPVRIL